MRHHTSGEVTFIIRTINIWIIKYRLADVIDTFYVVIQKQFFFLNIFFHHGQRKTQKGIFKKLIFAQVKNKF